MEQYLIYLRKSRSDLEAEAHGEGETLSRHEHTLLELAKRQHLNVTDIYREVVSGDTIAARPMMQRVLSEVEQSVWSGVSSWRSSVWRAATQSTKASSHRRSSSPGRK